MTDANKARFDAESATWDSNKKHVESCEKAFEALKKYVPQLGDGRAKDFDVLELGCGTGLLSFKLSPLVRSLIGIDTSDGMIEVFNNKIAALSDPSAANVAAVNTYLTSISDIHVQGAAAVLASRRGESGHDAIKPYRFDLIVSHLTLHHVESMPDTLRTLLECLKPGGIIALTDYEDFGPEAVAFHPRHKHEGVERHGIKRAEIVELLEGTGFNAVIVETAYVLEKEIELDDNGNKEVRQFPFLIMVAERSR